MEVEIKIGVGELVDKFTILALKKKKITDEAKLKNVTKEYDYINSVLSDIEDKDGIYELTEELYFTNEELWAVEDDLRSLEKVQDFGDDFIDLARSVYILNDKRAAIKKQINELYGSNLIEEKSYK